MFRSTVNKRLATLNRRRAPGEASESELSNLANLACITCQVPHAYVVLFEENMPLVESPRYSESPEVVLCRETWLRGELLIVPDVLEEERFARPEIMADPTQVRFFAGCPIVARNDKTIGVVCLVDMDPRHLSNEQKSGLKLLAAQAACVAEVRTQREEAVRVTLKYENLLFNLTTGFALHEIIVNDFGAPVDYRYLEVNPAFERLTGLKAEDAIGKTIRELIPGTESYWIETFGNVALTGQPTTYENYSAELGRYFNVWVFSPTKGQFAVVFTDVTASKESEKELVRLNESLEQRVEERTTKLDERTQELEFFSYAVSHDLRSPLRVIQGYASLLATMHAESEDSETSSFSKQIDIHSRRMAEMLDGIFMYSRIGATKLEPETFKLVEVIQPIVEVIESSPEAARTEIVTVLEDIEATLDADALAICVRNILHNAVKYSSSVSMPKVTISTKRVGDAIKIAISDNGIGIDARDHDRIFQMFDQLNPSSQGSGVGLALVAKAANRLGASIQVQSQQGFGSEFILSIEGR